MSSREPAAALSVRDLSVSYRHHRVLDGVSFEVAAGERLGIVGPNGAGKSTLLAVILGLVRPDAGMVHLGGSPLGRDRADIAYLPQRHGVDGDYPARVREVVAMGRYPHLGPFGRLRRADRDAVSLAIACVGLEHEELARWSELSGGQQQRAFIARALAQEAAVMLLDEPHAGIDAVTAEILDDCLEQAAGEGTAIVVVNHDLSRLGERHDRILLLHRRVIALGKPGEVLTPPALRATYGAELVVLGAENDGGGSDHRGRGPGPVDNGSAT